MRRVLVLMGCVLLNVGTLAQQPPPSSGGVVPADPASQFTFRSGIELVGLNVTVTDVKDRYIAGLGSSDFEVLEDGVTQDLAFFAASELPLDLALLIDTSASMSLKLDTVQSAAIGFIRTLRPGDRAAVMPFANGLREGQPMTDDQKALEAAVRRTTAGGGTALYNAVYVALKQLGAHSRENATVRRYAIVVLTDGEDTASLIGFEDVLDSARRSGVAIYTISVVSKNEALHIMEDSAPRYFSRADYDMKTLSRETGGRSFFPLQLPDLDGVYGEIANELSNQYSLGYAPKNPKRDGGFRKVMVRVLSRADARPRTRTGYFAASASAALLH
jgi:Ca-activated chloride channel homolog